MFVVDVEVDVDVDVESYCTLGLLCKIVHERFLFLWIQFLFQDLLFLTLKIRPMKCGHRELESWQPSDSFANIFIKLAPF